MIGAEDQPAAEDESADGEYGTQREVRDGQQGVTYSLEDFVERVEDTQVTQKCKPADHIPGCQCKVAGVGQNTFGVLILRRYSHAGASEKDEVITADYRQTNPS